MRPAQTIALVAATILAVLFAPAAVSAKSNQLSGRSVSPTSGTTSTTFAFRVSYVGFTAQSVSVTVAGMNLRMSLVSGSATDGAFAVSSRLPAGRWPVAFSASAAKGPQASLAGPNVVVSSPTVSPAPPSSTPRPVRSATAAPTATAVQSSTPSTTQSVVKPSSAASPAAIPQSMPAAAASASSAVNPSAGAAGAASGKTARPAPGTVTSNRPRSGAAPAGGGLLPSHDDAAVWEILLVGLMTVGAVAMGGAAWLLVAHHRRRAAVEADGGGAQTGAGLDPEVLGPDPALGRRSDRRMHLEAADDPILEAMGLNRHEAARPAVRGSQVNAGPGVRPPVPTRRV